MRPFRILAVGAAALLYSQSLADAETLTAEQVQSVMIGKRIDWATPDGRTTGYSMYKKNGSSTLTITAPNKMKDKGTWRIVGDEFCSKWTTIRDGQEACSTLRTTNQAGLYQMDTVFVRSN